MTKFRCAVTFSDNTVQDSGVWSTINITVSLSCSLCSLRQPRWSLPSAIPRQSKTCGCVARRRHSTGNFPKSARWFPWDNKFDCNRSRNSETDTHERASVGRK